MRGRVHGKATERLECCELFLCRQNCSLPTGSLDSDTQPVKFGTRPPTAQEVAGYEFFCWRAYDQGLHAEDGAKHGPRRCFEALQADECPAPSRDVVRSKRANAAQKS